MILTSENPSTGRGKPVRVPLCLQQISHELAWDRARTSPMRGRRLTAEADCTEALIREDLYNFVAMKFYGIVQNSESVFRQGISVGYGVWGITALLMKITYCWTTLKMGGPGSVVGIATGYGLDGLGIESRQGRDFPHLSRPSLWPTQPPVQWVPGLSRG